MSSSSHDRPARKCLATSYLAQAADFGQLSSVQVSRCAVIPAREELAGKPLTPSLILHKIAALHHACCRARRCLISGRQRWVDTMVQAAGCKERTLHPSHCPPFQPGGRELLRRHAADEEVGHAVDLHHARTADWSAYLCIQGERLPNSSPLIEGAGH